MQKQDTLPIIYPDQHDIHPLSLTSEQHRWSASPALNGHLCNHLLSRHLSGYRWYSEANVRRAIECAQAVELAMRAGRRDLETLFAVSLADLQDYDRAARACSLLPHFPEPIRNLPSHITIKRKRYDLQTVMLTMVSVEIPDKARRRLALIVREAMPDEVVFGEYVNRKGETGRRQIWAQYGQWLVDIDEHEGV